MRRASDFLFRQDENAKGRSSKRKWLRWLGYLLTASAFIYLLSIIVTGDLLSGLSRISIDPGTIITILLFYLLALVLQYLVWTRFASIYRKIDWHDVDIFSRTIFMRRLPGGFWHWLGRTALYAHDEKLDEMRVVQGNFVEWFFQLLSGTLLLIWISHEFPIIVRIAVPMPLMVIAYQILRTWHPPGTSLQRILGNLLSILVLYTLIWSLSVLIFYFVLRMTPSDSIALPQITRIWLTAGLSGVLTIPMPAAFGIQEAILTIQLQDLITKESALLLAILLRGIYIISDFIWGFIGWTASRFAIRREQD